MSLQIKISVDIKQIYINTPIDLWKTKDHSRLKAK